MVRTSRHNGTCSRIAVTGAAGYLGGRVVEAAAAAGNQVVAVARRPSPWLDCLSGVEVVLVDDLRSASAGNAFYGADTVIHLGAPNETLEDNDRLLAETVFGARAVGAAAAAASVGRVIYISTVHVYAGDLRRGVSVDEQSLPSPVDTYAVACLAAEHSLEAATHGAETDLVVFRLANAVGAPADPSVNRWSLLVNELCRQAICDGELRLRSDGMAWRDFLPMSDVTDVIVRAAQGPHGGIGSGTYNLCSGMARRVRDVADLVCSVIGTRTGRDIGCSAPTSAGDAPPSFAISAERLRSLGWSTTELADAIGETYEFCVEHSGSLSPVRTEVPGWAGRADAIAMPRRVGETA